MRQFACIRFGLSALLASTALCTPAAAQLVPPSPIKPTVDSNGVDLFDGKLNVRTPALTIGSNVPQGLAYYKYSRSGSGWSDNIIASLNLSGTTMTARFGEITDRFTVSGSSYISMEGNGSTLTFNGTTNVYTYTRADGTVIHFDKAYSTPSPYYSNEGRASDVIDPSGAKLAYSYDTFRYCDKWKPLQGEEVCIHHSYAFRVKTVRNSYGYQLTLNYAAYSPDPDAFDADLWSKVVGATATNLAVASGASTPSRNFSETYGINTYTLNATDPQGRVSKYRVISGGLVVGITLPGSAAEDMTIGYTSGRVTSVVKPAGTTNYSSSDASGIRTVTVTDPLSNATVYKFNIATERLTSITDANGRTRSMQYDSSRRLTRVTEPEGNYTQFTYDARGNVTEQRSVAKAGSGLADIVLTAGYSATCSNPKTCNQPNWTKDAKGNQTDFTYDSGHGGVLTATSPATAAGGVRPQTRFGYTSLQAYFKVSGSTITASGEPITLLTSTSTCQSLATCTGTADEVKSTVNYGPQLSGTGNNLLPVSMSKGAGDNSLTATTSLTYDDVGNLTYVDGPLPGTVDVTRALYNLDREMVGAIGPDPDGAGPLKNRSRRITIDSRGLVTKTESGTTNGQTDPDWAGFVAAEAVEVAYDSSRRPTVNSLTSGGTTYALTQTSYDAVGRPECVATRMNPATFGSLPASACTLGTTGSFGSDRITKTVYDAAGQITQNQVAVGTADAATERTLTYTNNGRLQTLKDAENNLTTYEYDGHDRLSKTRYPLPTQGSNASSTTDYEQLGYDAASNVTSRRLRDATSIVLGYDNLGRVTSKDLPGTEPDVTYAYDNLGRLTSASQTGNALSFTYDALSRNLTQVGPQGTVASQWDLAGRRTKLTYPGSGLYIDYDYLVTGETTKLRENGATSGVGVLATYAYDDLGRRTGLTFGNGAVQAYSYDPVSRLASLTNDLSGTGSDLSQTLAYNPASQITSAVRTGDAYAWTGHFNENKAGTPNGLNQLTQVGAKALTHDARGNVTAFGTKSFTYSSENLLLTGPNGTSLGYDPVMRGVRRSHHQPHLRRPRPHRRV